MGTAIAWCGELHQEAKISARQLKGKEPTGTTNTASRSRALKEAALILQRVWLSPRPLGQSQRFLEELNELKA